MTPIPKPRINAKRKYRFDLLEVGGEPLFIEADEKKIRSIRSSLSLWVKRDGVGKYVTRETYKDGALYGITIWRTDPYRAIRITQSIQSK